MNAVLRDRLRIYLMNTVPSDHLIHMVRAVCRDHLLNALDKYSPEGTISIAKRYSPLFLQTQCCGVDPKFEDGHRGFHESLWYKEFAGVCKAQAGQANAYPIDCCMKELAAKDSAAVACNGYQYCYEANIYTVSPDTGRL